MIKLPSGDSKQDVRRGNAHLIEWISFEAIDHFIHLRWFFEHVLLDQTIHARAAGGVRRLSADARGEILAAKSKWDTNSDRGPIRS